MWDNLDILYIYDCNVSHSVNYMWYNLGWSVYTTYQGRATRKGFENLVNRKYHIHNRPQKKERIYEKVF